MHQCSQARHAARAQLLVYRRGGVSERQLASALAEGGFHHISVSVVQRVVTDHKDAQQAPGQLITHYAPDVSTLLARPAVPAAAAAASAGAGVASEAHTTAGKLGTAPATEEPRFLVPDDSALDARELSPAPAAATALAAAIVVDFGGWLARQGLRSGCLAYRDLSPRSAALRRPAPPPRRLHSRAPALCAQRRRARGLALPVRHPALGGARGGVQGHPPGRPLAAAGRARSSAR